MAENCRSNWKIKIPFFRRPTAAIVYRHALREDICAQGADTQLSVKGLELSVVNMGDRAWAKFQAKMKQKRVQKKTKADAGGGGGIIHQRGALTVQRLSSEVSGKVQKFSRIGAREFVPFTDYDDITLPNIKLACEKHFSTTVGKSVMCDVLAAEQGPSCSTLEQIPDLRLIHIRFIPCQEHEQDHVENDSGKLMFLTPDIRKKKRTVSSVPVASISFESDATSPWSPKRIKVYPKSLSVSDMLKLGKVIKRKATTLIELRSFELDPMRWSLTATTVEFNIEKDPFGMGGFRKAYR